MTGWRKRTIMEMAREVGAIEMRDNDSMGWGCEFELHQLEAFAKLVREDALAQPAPVQEPVAWIYQNANTDDEYLVWRKGIGGRNWRPVYTIPPQRTWVGLTADEIHDTLKSIDPETKRLPKGLADFAYAVEAKLKERNI